MDIGRLVSVEQGNIHIISVDSGNIRPASVSVAHVDFPAEEYTGETAFTPGAETQVIPVRGKICTADFIIGPVPSWWGRISWDGNVLTVS